MRQAKGKHGSGGDRRSGGSVGHSGETREMSMGRGLRQTGSRTGAGALEAWNQASGR